MNRNVYGGALYARVLSLKHKFGMEGLQQTLAEMKKMGYAGPTDIEHIRPKQKYPIEYLQQMNQAILNIYGEEKLQQVAQDTANKKGIVGVFLKWAVTMEMIMKRAPDYWSEFYDFGTMRSESSGNEHKLILHDAYIDKLSCKYLTSYYKGILKVANIKGDISHTKCVGRGDDHCEWEIITGEQKKEQSIHTKEEIEEAGLYGSYSPEEVRDGILHCLIDMNMDEESARIMLQEQFKQADSSWDEPTKEDLQKIIDLLAQEAKNMRDDHTIQSNHNKIQKMINQCDCKGKRRSVPAKAIEDILEPEQEQADQDASSDEQVEHNDPVNEKTGPSNTMDGQNDHTEEQEPDLGIPGEPANQMCPYLDQCPIFRHSVEEKTEIIIARMWCTSEDLYKNCMRKQLKDAGRHVAKNMMPTGKYI